MSRHSLLKPRGVEDMSAPAPASSAASERLLTVSDVAEKLALRPATVRRMAASGLVGYHRLNGKELRFTSADVEGLLARTRVEALPAGGAR